MAITVAIKGTSRVKLHYVLRSQLIWRTATTSFSSVK